MPQNLKNTRARQALPVALIPGMLFALALVPFDASAEGFVHPFLKKLSHGVIGGLYIGQTQADVERILGHSIPIDDQSHNQLWTSLGDRGDLIALRVSNLEGARTLGAEVVFDNPTSGDRRIRGISVPTFCDDIPALFEKVHYDEAVEALPKGDHEAAFSDENGKIFSGITNRPKCSVWAKLYILVE
jgi:hypothetical protein